MALDEFFFHRRRNLPLWERLGHPADTLTVLVCWILILSTKPTPVWIPVYVCASVFSCLFVTKDEWVHARVCLPGEHWVHALLFLLHPLSFSAAGLLWQAVSPTAAGPQPSGLIIFQGFERRFFIVNMVLTVLFGLYQLIYWNLIWSDASNLRSTRRSMTS